jgi:hypothetical protein
VSKSMLRVFGRQGTVGALLLFLLAGPARAQDLAPPPPIDPNAPGAPNRPPEPANTGEPTTVQQLETAEREDSGRNFEIFYVNAEVGGSYINMESFSSSSLQLAKSSSGGPMFGLGGGLRLLIFTVGARARLHQLSAFSLWDLNGELGLHIPIKKVDLYLGLHGGYTFVGTLGDATIASPNPNVASPAGDTSIHGFDAGLSLGFDYYLSSLFSLGVDGTGDFLFLKRPPVALPASVALLTQAQRDVITKDPLYAKSGDSVGFGISVSLHAGLHFGF